MILYFVIALELTWMYTKNCPQVAGVNNTSGVASGECKEAAEALRRCIL